MSSNSSGVRLSLSSPTPYRHRRGVIEYRYAVPQAYEPDSIKTMLLTPSWTEELAQLQLRALRASEAILAGEPGPIFIGQASKDAFYRLVNGLNRTLHLSWESVDDSDMGRIYYFGDPSTTHQLLAAYVCDVISTDTAHNGVSGTQLGVVTTELSIPAPTTRNPGAIRRRIKEPDASWLAKWVMLSTMQDRLSSVLEVAWHNESWTEFAREVEDWAMAGYNVLGIKVWPAQTSRAQGSRSKGMSLVFVARAAKASTMRIWRFGDKAESQDARRAGVEVLEGEGDAIFLPACWFGYGDTTQTKQVSLSLASLVDFAAHAAHQSETPSVARGLTKLCETLRREIATIETCQTLPPDILAPLIRARQQHLDRAIQELGSDAVSSSG